MFSEWRVRAQRIRDILRPPVWSPGEWNEFARVLAQAVRRYGKTWENADAEFWDIRWELQEGGELVCQVEQIREKKLSLVVAQYGGFADGTENYIWFYCEFSENGKFLGEPFWVEGTWKDALSMLLMPHKASSGFYLTGGTSSPAMQHMLLGGGADRQD
ncbi:MAG: hypothetical protein LBD30_04705 [Verrucomicrobiales bacterium]|nr:hypothetical protein [Verrucomicrobiales bacterium]